jgi:hypothetical protein
MKDLIKHIVVARSAVSAIWQSINTNSDRLLLRFAHRNDEVGNE